MCMFFGSVSSYVVCLMVLRPPGTTRTATRVPYTTLVRARDEAQVPQVEGCRCGGGEFHQLADLVVAQGDGRVVQLGGAAARAAFDEGVGQGARKSTRLTSSH